MEPLRIYTDRKLSDPWAYIPLLYPFWGSQVKNTTPYLKAAYTKHGWDGRCFTPVERPEDAEYIVVPHEYWWLKQNRPDLLDAYVKLSEEHHVPLIVDAMSDTGGEIRLPHARIMRTNQYRFRLPSNEITTPYAVEDLLESHCGGRLQKREKGATPSVGFIGFAGIPLARRVQSILRELPIRLKGIFDSRYRAMQRGIFWRERAMRVFSRSGRLTCRFFVRSSYSGHVKTIVGDMQKNREEFVRNLLDSDYALVVRGDPNASQRLYEALSLGRIPIIINTECVFPLEEKINYREFCVIINHTDLARAPDILADFHARLSPEEFSRMQERAREVFERYLRIDSFSPYLVELLRARTAVAR